MRAFLKVLASHASKIHPDTGLNKRAVPYPAVRAILRDFVHAWDPVTWPVLLTLRYGLYLGARLPQTPCCSCSAARQGPLHAPVVLEGGHPAVTGLTSLSADNSMCMVEYNILNAVSYFRNRGEGRALR